MSCRLPWRPSRNLGFTLTEVMISLLVLIIIMVLSMSLLFSLRGFGLRQRLFAEPRQSGRQGVEYIAENIRQAAIISRSIPGGQGVIVPYVNGVQASWNNCATPAIADRNTDVICVNRPQGSSTYQVVAWPGSIGNQTIQISYTKGCPDNASNRSKFLDEVQATTGKHTVMLVDQSGSVLLDDINWNGSNPTSVCAGSSPNYTGSLLTIPGNIYKLYAAAPTMVEPVYVTPSPFVTLRVKNGQLQQKFGCMDAANPDVGFTPLMENVVDLQFTYYMQSGAIFNNTAANRFTGANQIPNDVNLADALSCSNVLGVGIYLVTRSAQMAPLTMARPHPFPLSADRTAAPTVDAGGYFNDPAMNLRRDRLFYYQANTNAFIRNRILGF
jgi:hypothetical protein